MTDFIGGRERERAAPRSRLVSKVVSASALRRQSYGSSFFAYLLTTADGDEPNGDGCDSNSQSGVIIIGRRRLLQSYSCNSSSVGDDFGVAGSPSSVREEEEEEEVTANMKLMNKTALRARGARPPCDVDLFIGD